MPRRQRIEVARTIDRPLDVVFNALSDERESPQWRSATAADYDVGGPCVIGAKFWRAAGGRRREAFEVTSCEPYRVYATAAVEGGAVEAINCRRIDALTTEVEWVLERPASAVGALIAWRRRRAMRSELDAAADWLEAAAR